jgi:hypothetical protein
MMSDLEVGILKDNQRISEMISKKKKELQSKIRQKRLNPGDMFGKRTKSA